MGFLDGEFILKQRFYQEISAQELLPASNIIVFSSLFLHPSFECVRKDVPSDSKPGRKKQCDDRSEM